MKKRPKQFIILILLFILFSSCNKDHIYNLEFQDSYTNWLPPDSINSFSFTSPTNKELIFEWNYSRTANNLIYINTEGQGTSYYYADKISTSYLCDAESMYIRYDYYLQYMYDYGEVDILEISINEYHYSEFNLRINTPNYVDEIFYAEYANYLFAESITLNGIQFNTVYYRESLEGDAGIYYQKYNGVIAIKSENITYVLNQ